MPEGNLKPLADAVVKAVEAIGAVAATGYHKDQHYAYLSDDDIFGAARRGLEAAGIVFAPVSAEITETTYKTKDGKDWVRCLAIVTYRVIHAESGAWIDIIGAGQGTDPGDKSAYKAQIGAFKAAARTLFLIFAEASAPAAGRAPQPPPARQAPPRQPPPRLSHGAGAPPAAQAAVGRERPPQSPPQGAPTPGAAGPQKRPAEYARPEGW